MAKKYVTCLLIIILFIVSFNGCFSGKIQKNIKETQTASVFKEKATIGNLEDHKVKLDIPANTFEENVNIQISNPDKIPSFDKNEGELVGAPLEIQLDSKNKRLNNKTIITMKLNDDELEGVKFKEDIWIAYFNGKNWDYFLPDKVDLNNRILKFSTYHFSLFSKVKLTKDQRIKEFIKKDAVEKWAKDQGKDTQKQLMQQMVNKILEDKLGIVDKSLAQDVVEGIIKQNDYTKLLTSYNDNKMDEFGQDLAVLAGKEIFETVKEYDLKGSGLLDQITQNASKIGTGVKMTVAIAEGRFEDAAKDLSNEILDSFPVTKVLKTGAEIIDRQITRWKSEELEAAFEVYKNGAQSSVPWWGYQVEAGKFEQVWDQMKGLQTKILDDAIKEYAKINNVDVDKLGSKALDKIREDAKRKTKEEFESRLKHEKELEKIQEDNLKLIKIFDKAKLLNKGSFGYTKDCSLELMLTRLMKMKEKVLTDTNAKLGFSGLNTSEVISADTVANLIQIWYTDDGKEKYTKKLIELGYLDESELYNIEGSWSGTLTITHAPPELSEEGSSEPKVIDSKDDLSSMCGDIQINLIGVVVKCNINLKNKDDGYKGTIEFSDIDDDESTKLQIGLKNQGGNSFAGSVYNENQTIITLQLKLSGEKLEGEFEFTDQLEGVGGEVIMTK